MQTWEAVIDEAPPSANVYMRMHWAVRKRMKEHWYYRVLGAFGRSTPTLARKKRRVEIIITTRRMRDHSNLWLGADKLILDAMVKLGWLVDDDPTHADIHLTGAVGTPKTFIRVVTP